MTRNIRCVIGLLMMFVVGPLLLLLWPDAPPVEYGGGGCMDALGFGGVNKTPTDYTLPVAAGVGVVGAAFVISCFFGGDSEEVAA
jgi:hypothetical protein